LEQSISNKKRLTVEKARLWNQVVDMAVLLEPVYWPRIVDRILYSLSGEEHESILSSYRSDVLEVVRRRDAKEWQRFHEELLREATWMDKNTDLYVLLRLSLWGQRERVRGRLAGALWIRHMAEVIRRGFEEAHGVEWPEEDGGVGFWHPSARVRQFGLERPFDDVLRAKPFIAYHFGLFTGSSLRWHVEGNTEYYAVSHALKDAPKRGVELVNLRGEIAREVANAAIKLQDALLEDMAQRRFSMISFDRDVSPNERAVRQQIKQDRIVGEINANLPDFEFANFSLSELVEVAASLDEQCGVDATTIRNADWSGINGGTMFAEKYEKISLRGASLKGELWGKALAEHAMRSPIHPSTGVRRRFIEACTAALWAWHSNYEDTKERYTFDPQTFERVERKVSSG
jgi:hypothetical protein